jgi:acetyl-CoA carboxylase/biotin carboxylase 1
MFDEVLKYGSLIVDAFVSFEQPVFVFIPPFAEIRGGAWVVLDASINSSVMEMYAAKGSARGGVLEAAGAATVKYRSRDLVTTMHRLDSVLHGLDARLAACEEEERASIFSEISKRERVLLPVYEQIAVQFCDLHDRTGRMKAVGVINREVEWREARSFFYWRLRRKLAEFDLRRQLIQAAEVGRGVAAPTPLQATATIKKWFLDGNNGGEDLWDDDRRVLAWMAESYSELEQKILLFTKEIVVQEVIQVMTAGGNTARIGAAGIVEGLERAIEQMDPDHQQSVKQMLLQVINK